MNDHIKSYVYENSNDLTTIVDINYFYSIVNCDKKCYIIFVKIFTK